MARNRLIAGAITNRRLLDADGLACSLINSLMASANGWGSPIRLGLLGPFRV